MTDNEKTCPECAENVKAAARICRFCGYAFHPPVSTEASSEFIPNSPAGSGANEANSGVATKPKFAIIAALVLGVGVLGAYQFANTNTSAQNSSGDSDSTTLDASEAAADTAIAAADAAMAAAEAAGDEVAVTSGDEWTYETSRDEVRNSEIKTASLSSDNQIYLSAPYDGGTRAQISIRRHPEYGVDVMLKASPSQMLCDSYSGCSIDINIDGKTQKLGITTPSDHDTELLFVRDGRSLVKKLKASKRVIIELPFYSNGNGQFQFNTSGLKWD